MSFNRKELKFLFLIILVLVIKISLHPPTTSVSIKLVPSLSQSVAVTQCCSPADKMAATSASADDNDNAAECDNIAVMASSPTTTTTDGLLNVSDEATPPKNCFRLVLLGSSKVGKTALVTRFLDNRYDDKYTPTIENFHRKIYNIRGESYRLDLLDTSGNNPFPAMRRLSLMTGQCCVVLFFRVVLKLVTYDCV